MVTIKNDTQLITEIVEMYFRGTYDGNAEKLKLAFHPDARITGSINGENYDWSLNDFISKVSAVPTAANRNEPYNKNILNIDITNGAASVKARVTVGPLVFTDYITLLKINGKWIIRNKSFTN